MVQNPEREKGIETNNKITLIQVNRKRYPNCKEVTTNYDFF